MLEQSIDAFIQLVQDHRVFGYTILFIAMVLEGETFLIIAGMLASLKAFDTGDVLWISFAGVVLGNIMWYQFGAHLKGAGLSSRIIKRAERMIAFFLPRFRERPFKSIFFSKFIYGANRATVIMSGVFRVPFKLFFRAEFLASIVWVILYFSVGYFFGEIAIEKTHNVARVALAILVFVIAFALIQKVIARYYGQHERKKLESDEKDSNS